MPGVSVLFGEWLPCSFSVCNPPWSAGALLFGVSLPSFLFISYLLIFYFLLFLSCALKRVDHVSTSTSFPHKTSPCILLSTSVFLPPLFLLFYPILRLTFYLSPSPVVPMVWVSIYLYLPALVVCLPFSGFSFLSGFSFWLFGWYFLNPFPYFWFHKCGHFCGVFFC